MRVQSLIPEPEKKVAFKLASYKFVPHKAGCYVLTTFDDEILYIGLTVNLHNRFKQHMDSPEKVKPTPNGKSVWFHFSILEINVLHKFERSWMHQYSSLHGEFPVLNKISSPV